MNHTQRKVLMSDGAPGGVNPTLAEGVRTAEHALENPAPIRGVIDLPPFDAMVGTRSMESRRRAVYEQLPVAIPLPLSAEEVAETSLRVKRNRNRKILLWSLFVLFLVSTAAPESSPFFFIAWIVAFGVTRRSARRNAPPTLEPIPQLGRSHAPEHELRVVWTARRQVADILGTRAWKSEELRGSVAVADLAEVLTRLTDRALGLFTFLATALPRPSEDQPELLAQWRKEQDRIHAARRELVQQLAALIIYRQKMDRVSDLLDQRDQMSIYAERAAAFDELVAGTPEQRPLLNAVAERREVEDNLTAQIHFLAEIADSSGTAGPLSGVMYGQ